MESAANTRWVIDVNVQWNGHEWKTMGCDPGTAAANAEQSVINGYDLGDLLTEIDGQIGQTIEKTAHRYVPKPIAQDLRKRVVRQMADYAINHSRQLET